MTADSVIPAKRASAKRVMVVEDSPTARTMLLERLAADPRVRVAFVAATGEEALRALHDVQPDVVSLDIRLPGIDGIQLTREIMRVRPTPIVICSASIDASEAWQSMNALRAGALAVVEKPRSLGRPEFDRMARRLCDQIVAMSEVRMVRHRFPPCPPCIAEPGGAELPDEFAACGHAMVGIVASTGGPRSLVQLLSSLPPMYPIPILLVQHMTPSFHDGFVSWLDANVPLNVCSAQRGEVPKPGRIYVAPPHCHLQLRRGRLQLFHGDSDDLNRPSGTHLLQSMADDLGPRAVGVVLTGMGADGSSGLLAIRRAGGLTVAESESTAVVYGMPHACAEIGAAARMLPLDKIAPALCKLACVEGVPA